MLSLVQKQLDQINTENFKTMKNTALDAIQDADVFLNGYQDDDLNKTQSKTLGGPLQAISEFKEEKKGQKLIAFPYYTHEGFSKVIKAEFNLKNLNCDRNDFINA